MIVVGLTGSIAMGKSETARMFVAEGIPVFDSDAEVHRMYGKSGKAVAAVETLFPEAIVNGAVDRSKLAQAVLGDAAALRRLEAIVHPLVRESQTEFLSACRARGEAIAVLDIPLLFETGREQEVDRIVVVSAPPEIQRRRALGRPGMTAEKLDSILGRQIPDAEKRRRADFVVDTSHELAHARAQVAEIVASLRREVDSAT